MNLKLATLVFAIAMLGGVFIPRARADQLNKAILFSITGPVEVPGRVLEPGRYQLKLEPDGSSIAELRSADGSQFYGYFSTIPVDRSRAGRSKVLLSRSVPNAPKRIEEWFYGGNRTGNELLYPTAK